MPRKTRVYFPDILVHVVQRGNNKEACLFSDEDYYYYKSLLIEVMRRYGARIHAYCLMTNHVHLLMTPKYTDSISRII
jgi:putative transposase